MAISLVSTSVITATLNTPVTLLAAGNYSLQELQIIIAGVQITTAGTVYEFQGNLSSGGNIFHFIDAIGTVSPNGWQPLNLSQGKTFPNLLKLSPNSSIVFTPTTGTNLGTNAAVITFNISGFKQ